MSLEFRIRPLTIADEPFLWEMLYQALFVPPGCLPFSREVVQEPEISRYVDGWGTDGDLGVIAICARTQAPIGAAWVRLLAGDESGYGWVDDETPELTIAVLPGSRGKGVGSQLLAQLMELARARYRAISLSVAAENPARRLYERLGFLTVAWGEYVLTMKKDLK